MIESEYNSRLEIVNTMRMLTGITKAKCTCGKFYSGDYCEDRVDICTIEVCYNQSSCKNSVPEGENPCGDCPAGYRGDGRTCASN